ncbi:MAG TPA: PblA [Candidatus Jeotgalibaca merdavium]|uniref:PblA n=1 Tax=Candidatus Jeotgalibaca merdavium TaxID=2838627 RepID=A0A9D2KWK7_9LACT|nr:PblA [Candidatus Jeotgalibaca merdavium]
MATELGQAYVQIIPSAKGIGGKIQAALGPESESAGKSAGLNIAGAIKGAIAAAGIGAALKSVISEGAALEQSLGGIETLFKGNADTVKQYAKEAYRTVGLSANDYMENVTSFSASLLQSMGGDTEAAAEIANMAMVDMGDNANKMGTNMQDIQNAYQGFAKQNYTMLDNLKLGYGGTKSEMERLLADAQAFSGVEYDLENLDDVYSAIHVIQQEMDIAGTTSKEAAETISGSLSAMKGAFKNVMGDLALGNDLKPALTALAQTVSTFLFDNLIPMVGNIISALPGAIMTFIQVGLPSLIESGMTLIRGLGQGFVTAIPELLMQARLLLVQFNEWLVAEFPQMVTKGVEFIVNFANGFMGAMPNVLESIGEILRGLLTALFNAMPTILDGGFQLITGLAQGLWNNLPAVVTTISSILSNLIQTIIERYPDYFKKGWEIVGKLAMGLWNNLPTIISTIGNLLGELIGSVAKHFPKFLEKGFELIIFMAEGLLKALPNILAKIPEIINALLTKFGELTGQFVDIGVNIVQGLWNGISSVKDWILGKISGFVDGILGGVKGFFGIHSPSKVMADQVGKFLPAGIAVGIEDNMQPVFDAMDEMSGLTTGSFESEISMEAAKNGSFANLSTPAQQQPSLSAEELLRIMDNRPYEVHVSISENELIRIMGPGMSKEIKRLNNAVSRGEGVVFI